MDIFIWIGENVVSMNWKTKKILRMLRRKSYRAVINDLIDLYIHPMMKRDSGYKAVDFVLHAINEGDLEKSVRKFLRYNTPLPRSKRRSCRKR